MFENSNDTCFSYGGMFFYANDQFRFVIPFYANGPKKNLGAVANLVAIFSATNLRYLESS
jgi:hypothetical protein